MSNEECAKVFCNAIRTMANNPDKIDNLESYLENCFDVWMDKFANTPAGIAREMQAFAEIDLIGG